MIKDLIKFCKFVFLWGVVPGTILALAAVAFLGPRVDEEIRAQVQRRIADHYRDVTVAVRSAVRVEGRGIEVRDLAIFEPDAENPQAAMLHVEQIFLQCQSDLVDLVGCEVRVDHVTVRRPTLRLTRLPDGTWSGRQLWPPPKFSEVPPATTIENGTVEIVDLSKNPPSTMTFRDVNLTAENLPRPAGDSGPIVRVMRGTLTGDHVGRIEIEGRGDPDRLDWQMTGTVHGLEISPELRKALPTPLAEQLAMLAGFRGRVALNFRAQNDPAAPAGFRFEVAGQIAEGRFDHPRLPYPWTNARGTIRADNQGFLLENLFAQGDRATLWVAQARHDFGRALPRFVKAKVTQFTLDERLRAFLPEAAQAQWDRFRPGGEVDVTAELVSDGQRFDAARSRATVECRDVSFAYHRFPYPLEHGRGTLRLENDVLVTDLVAASGNRDVRLSGEIRRPLDGPRGWFEAQGQDMPVDGKFRAALDALNEQTRNTFDAMAPVGRCDFWFRAERNLAEDPWARRIVVDVKSGAIRFKHFPYPIENLRGRFERFADGRWEFRDLEGTNDTAQVRCDGQLFDGPRGKQLALTLTGRNVPLDKELHDSLKSSMQQAWDNLEPTGTIDLETNVTWLVEPKKLELVVVARPRADAASIKPRMFPYLMEKLQGTLVYRDGRVTFDDFHARHGRTEITGRGQWDFLPDGSWDFCIRDVAVDRLRPDDRDLLQALPGRLRESLARLNIEGTMYLARGRFDVHHSPAVAAPTRTAWDARLGLQPGRISCGLSIDNIRGEVALRGESDGATFSSEGELDVESLSYKKLQFTEVRGPLWIEPDRVLFGSWVAKREQQPNGAPIAPPRAVTGRLLGGTVRADAWVAPKFTPCYALNAELLGADLAQYATETMTGRQELKGRMGMTLNLMGRRPTIAGLQGGGRMWLRDGDVYKLPVMIAMLKLLSMQEPDVTAFSDADILFQIAGDHVYLSQIQFNGDAVSLVGQGELDFQSNIDLAFSARLGRNKWQVPILTPLMGEASRQTMVIKVRGPLYDPEASRDVLPGVKEALRELEANLRSSPAAGPGQPAFGQPNPGPNPLRR